MNRTTPPAYDESALDWFTSSFSENGATCVEVARVPGSRVAVRDSKVDAGPHFAIGTPAFAALVNSVVDETV